MRRYQKIQGKIAKKMVRTAIQYGRNFYNPIKTFAPGPPLRSCGIQCLKDSNSGSMLSLKQTFTDNGFQSSELWYNRLSAYAIGIVVLVPGTLVDIGKTVKHETPGKDIKRWN